MKLRLLYISLLTLSLFGCASSYDKVEVEKVRTVAVVGFTYDYNLPMGKALLGGLMGKERKLGGPGSLMGKTQNKLVQKPVSQKSYQYLTKALRKTGWRVLKQSDLKRSPTLAAIYRKKIKVGTLPLESNHERYRANGVEQFHYTHYLKKNGAAQKIAKELGVDALVFTYFNTDLKLALLGMGKTKYKSKITMELYSPKVGKKIMFESITGDAITKTDSAKALAAFNGSKTQYNTFKSSVRAIDQLVAKVQNKINK